MTLPPKFIQSMVQKPQMENLILSGLTLEGANINTLWRNFLNSALKEFPQINFQGK